MNFMLLTKCCRYGVVSLLVPTLLACNGNTGKASIHKDDKGSPKVVIPRRGDGKMLLPALNELHVNGAIFSAIPCEPAHGNPDGRSLIFRYYVDGDALSMKGWLYEKRNRLPAGGETAAAAISMEVGAVSNETFNKVFLSALNLSYDNVIEIKDKLGGNPARKNVLFIPYTAMYVSQHINEFPAGIQTDDGFVWKIVIIDTSTYKNANNDFAKIKFATTPTSATFNPSPPRELTK